MEIPKRHCQEWWNCNETSYGARYVCFFVSSQWKGMVSSCCWTPYRLIINIIYNDYISLYLNMYYLIYAWFMTYCLWRRTYATGHEIWRHNTNNFKLQAQDIQNHPREADEFDVQIPQLFLLSVKGSHEISIKRWGCLWYQDISGDFRFFRVRDFHDDYYDYLFDIQFQAATMLIAAS